MPSLDLHQMDVFTTSIFAGNPAAVVMAAEARPAGLLDATMARIAREMNLSETAFVFGRDERGRVPVRFFTPTHEVPACGHATLAAHAAMALASGAASGNATQISPGGEWRISWEQKAEGCFVTMAQELSDRGDPWAKGQRDQLLRALRLDERALMAEWPVQAVSTGHAKIIVPIRDRASLAAVEPEMTELRRLSDRTGVNGFFLFAPSEGRHRTHARMFAPAIGIPEDPVNGSGHGALAAYLAERPQPWAASVRRGFWSSMGHHLDRPGEVWVRWVETSGRAWAEVGGYVTPVFRGVLHVDSSAL